MEAKVQKMEEQLDRIEKSIERMAFYIYSDSNTNRKGLAEKLEILESILEDVITRGKIYRAKATVWGMVGAFILSALWKVVTLVIK